MEIRVESEAKGRCKAVVEGNLTIYEAAAGKPVLLDALAKAADMEIDLSSVTEMDTAGLQLLILVKRESLKAGKLLRLVGHSQPTLDVLDLYNLASYFGDPVVITPRRQKKNPGAKSRGKRGRP